MKCEHEYDHNGECLKCDEPIGEYMKINTTMEVEVFDDTAEEICLEFLKKEYANLTYNPIVVVPLDAVDNNRLLASMARVIEYYSNFVEYKEFMEEVHGE
jgi:hypothetical protein